MCEIPLIGNDSGPGVVGIDFRYECLPHLCYYYGLITHDIKVCRSVSGLNVRFDSRHANFGE